MKLADYLSERGLTDQAFADLIGKERSVVSRYRVGQLTPRLEVIDLIEKATGGLVSFRDFLPDTEAAE